MRIPVAVMLILHLALLPIVATGQTVPENDANSAIVSQGSPDPSAVSKGCQMQKFRRTR